ncbi:MAG: LLM class flavin-dependent oxidoreductase [Candidatus Bathyarchaeia archaeon]
MKFGISHSPFQWWTNSRQLEEWVLKVEEMGYDGLFVPDHYSLPLSPKNQLVVDAWTTIVYIAAKSSKTRIGSIVTPVPRWIPSQLAKIIASADILSNGRIIAALGAGWCRDEFVNYAPKGAFDFDNPKIRFEKFLEGTEIMIKLWTEESVTFKGKYYTLEDAVLYPKPVQKPYPPLWCGGHRSQMIKAAAKYFDGWIPSKFELPANFGSSSSTITCSEQYRSLKNKITEYLQKFGRDVNKFTFGLLGEMPSVELLEKYRDAGCQYYVFDLVPPGKPVPSTPQCIEITKKFAKEIISSF